MPSDTVTPASLAWSGGNVGANWRFETVTPSLMAWAAGTVLTSRDSSLSDVTVPDLDRLTPFDQLFNKDGTPAVRLMTIWQDMCEQIEASFAAQATQITDLTAIVSRLDAAETLAQSAVDTAATTAATVELTNSWTTGATLTPSIGGGVTVSAHTRHYSTTSTVSVSGGSVSGFAAGDVVYIYYDDAGRTGGAVSYQGTTGVVAQEGSRHIVGAATIPESGQAVYVSGGTTPPGYEDPDWYLTLAGYRSF